MGAETENIYRQIGQQIARTIPESWIEAYIIVTFESGVVSAQGYYTTPKAPDQRSFLVSGDVNRLFASLRQLVRKDEKHMFSSAKFSLRTNGEFGVKFEY